MTSLPRLDDAERLPGHDPRCLCHGCDPYEQLDPEPPNLTDRPPTWKTPPGTTVTQPEERY